MHVPMWDASGITSSGFNLYAAVSAPGTSLVLCKRVGRLYVEGQSAGEFLTLCAMWSALPLCGHFSQKAAIGNMDVNGCGVGRLEFQ